MSTYQRRFVGAEQLPRHLSEFDVEQFFRLLPDDVVAIRDRFRSDRGRLVFGAITSGRRSSTGVGVVG